MHSPLGRDPAALLLNPAEEATGGHDVVPIIQEPLGLQAHDTWTAPVLDEGHPDVQTSLTTLSRPCQVPLTGMPLPDSTHSLSGFRY